MLSGYITLEVAAELGRKAFQLLFEYPDKVVESTASSPNSIPQIIDNFLVISTWGLEEGNYKQFFELDTQKNALKFIKTLS